MEETNKKISEIGVNIQEKATVIWNIANALVGYFKPHEYGTVILPMTVIKRFHDCLISTREKVLATYEDVKNFEVVPLKEDIDAYFEREVLPYAPDAWIDKTKTKVGYEIPMTRYFYKYQAPEKSEEIKVRIDALEADIANSLRELFGGE